MTDRIVDRIQELVRKADELHEKAGPLEWFAWFRTPKGPDDGGGNDISVKTLPEHPDHPDDWIIAEFFGWGKKGTPEFYENADAQRQLAITLRNNWPLISGVLKTFLKQGGFTVNGLEQKDMRPDIR